MLEMWVEQLLETHSRCRVSFVSFRYDRDRVGEHIEGRPKVPSKASI